MFLHVHVSYEEDITKSHAPYFHQYMKITVLSRTEGELHASSTSLSYKHVMYMFV